MKQRYKKHTLSKQSLSSALLSFFADDSQRTKAYPRDGRDPVTGSLLPGISLGNTKSESLGCAEGLFRVVPFFSLTRSGLWRFSKLRIVGGNHGD